MIPEKCMSSATKNFGTPSKKKEKEVLSNFSSSRDYPK